MFIDHYDIRVHGYESASSARIWSFINALPGRTDTFCLHRGRLLDIPVISFERFFDGDVTFDVRFREVLLFRGVQNVIWTLRDKLFSRQCVCLWVLVTEADLRILFLQIDETSVWALVHSWSVWEVHALSFQLFGVLQPKMILLLKVDLRDTLYGW